MAERDDPIGTPGGTPERPALFFADAGQWRAWLERHHETETGLWMGLRKKHVADRGLTWAEAVPEALCFGWIDSIVQRIDEDTVRQRWTPRKPGSTWSLVNVALVEQLLEQGRMRPAGLAAYERRRAEATGRYTYEQGELGLPAELEERLRANAPAAAFWDASTASYRKLCTNWVLSAKREETRMRRFAQLLDDCAHGRLVPPQRYGEPPSWLSRAARAATEAT